MARLRLLALLALFGVAADEPPPPVWEGVWQGAIGTLPVRACLQRTYEGDGQGAYFYLSRLRTIALEQAGASKVWSEGEAGPKDPPPPRWTFAAVGHDLLTGRWSDGKRTFPFRLTRLAQKDGDAGPCGSDAFNGPRWRPLTVTVKAAVKDGVRYRELAFHPGPAFPEVELDTFALEGDDPATRRINQDLRRDVPGTGEDWRGCIAGGLDAHGVDGDYRASVAPDLITPRWLAATLSSEQDCGGVHPNSASTPLTWDRRTGAAVDLDSWLNDAALARDPADKDAPPTVRPALHRAILAAAAPIDPDCRDALERADVWLVALDRAGLGFTPDLGHAEQACADETVVPWARLARFLGPAGVAGQRSLGADTG